MKRIIMLLFVVMSLGITANAQEGVKFEELTFKEALAKAKAENKLVFMDCYTSWCAPCKRMLNTVFVTKEAGDFFNPRFVSVKYDMEKGEGIELAKQFNVKSFPTFFIFRPDGSIQHKIGGAGSLKSFVAWVERGLNEETSFDYLNKQYDKGAITKDQLLTYYWVLICAGEEAKANKILEELKKQVVDSDKLKADYWFLIEGTPYGSADFNFILNNFSKLKESVGLEKLDKYLAENYNKTINEAIQKKTVKDENGMKKLFGQISKEWASCSWTPDKRLQNKLKLLEACAAQDSKRIISCMDSGLNKQENTKWNFDLWVILSALDFVNVSGEKVDNAKVLALETRINGYFASSESMKKRLEPYFEKFR